MAREPLASDGRARPAHRRGVLDAVARALARAQAGDGGWVLFEGPPGRGGTWAVSRALELAEERGLSTVRISGRALEAAPGDGAPLLSGAGEPPDVVGIDDLQYLGPSALRELDHGRDGQPPPRVVVASVRTGVPPADPAGLAFARARGATTLVPLEPLDVTEVRDVLERAGVRGSAGLAPAAAALTSGNVLVLKRLIEHLPTAGRDLAPDALEHAAQAALPRVARFCEAHLATLGPDAEALVGAVIVLGDDAPLWLAADVAGLAREGAAAAAGALMASGLLASVDPLRRELPLAWRAMARASEAPPRHDLRRRAARLLATTAGGIEAAAEHLLATPAAGEDWVAPILREAAERAMEDGRRDAAIALLERALEEPAPAGLRRQLLVELGDAREHAEGGRAEALAAYREALRLSDREERAAIHLRIGRTLYGGGDYRGSALELDRGLGLVAAGDELEAELIAAYIAAARFDRTLEDAAADHLAPLLDRSGPGRTSAERALLAEIALERGIRGKPRSTVVGLALRAWADGLLLEGADPYGIALSQVAAALTWSDAFAESDVVLTATVDHAERRGEPQLAATARYLRAWPRYYLGALADAETDVRSALGATGWEMYEPSARAILGHVLVERGEHAAAWEALSLTSVETWRRTVPYAMLLETRSRLHVAAGDLEAAAADLAEAGALLDTMGNRSPFCPWRSRLGLVSLLRGDVAAARELVGAELAQAEAIGTPRATGVALCARGTIGHLADGDGVTDLARAADALAACGARVEHARALVGLGAALAGTGRRKEARTPLHDAIELATAINAREIAERAERELRRAGGRRSRSTGGPAAGGLTASELRVARLAALGRTNREIAEELVVSPHTVRFHLAGVYRKLRIERREDIAARLREHDDGASSG